MDKNGYIENEFCEYWIDENGIIHEIFKPTFDVLNLQIAKLITQDRLRISDKLYRPLYVELGNAVKMEREANRYLSSGEAMHYLTATGILVRDQIERFGASLYTTFFKPEIPTRFFTDKKLFYFG